MCRKTIIKITVQRKERKKKKKDRKKETTILSKIWKINQVSSFPGRCIRHVHQEVVSFI